jgi:hypothetical protein
MFFKTLTKKHVYVLTEERYHNGYDSEQIIAIFNTQEKAIAYIEEGYPNSKISFAGKKLMQYVWTHENGYVTRNINIKKTWVR